MATYSTLLNLKLNDPTDPFLLSDFVSNYEILDASPGVFVCTSSSRPTWGSGQAGRMIFMTDYKQLSYWTGSAWADLRDSAPVFFTGSVIGTSIASGSTPTFTVLTFTTPRACSMSLWVSASYECDNRRTQQLTQSILFDGADQHGAFVEYGRFEGSTTDSGQNAGISVMSQAVVGTVTAGSHTAGLKINLSANYTSSVELSGVKIMAMISTFSNSNTL